MQPAKTQQKSVSAKLNSETTFITLKHHPKSQGDVIKWSVSSDSENSHETTQKQIPTSNYLNHLQIFVKVVRKY